MQTLDVVNLMLGTLGEKPLSSLNDSHALLPAALGKLDKCNNEIQADGWWFNLEDVTLYVNPVDQSIYLPNDCLGVRTPSYRLIKRGNRIYNLTGGTYVFTDAQLDVELVRMVPFEDLPEVAAQYIAAVAVLSFQSDFDGDTARARLLSAEVMSQKIKINSENTRNRKVNLLNSNVRLAYLKSFTRKARYNIG
jgi:hypothetical protein